MTTTILDNLEEIKKLDSRNMLGSLELLGAQVEQVRTQAQKIRIPKNYKNFQNIVVLGMGGSTLGAHIIKSVFFSKLTVPLEIIHGYHVPHYVGSKTLVVVSSYSGTTEEPIAAMKEAVKRKAKLVIISSGGALVTQAKKLKVPALIFTTENNPCGSPRMGLGYSIVGQILLLAKIGAITLTSKQLGSITHAIKTADTRFGVGAVTTNNIAKQIAQSTQNRSVWYVGAEHLIGNVHASANQMNENAKRFGGYYLIPELNHHLMEGMMQPKNNPESLLFVLVESSLYNTHVQKRFSVTKDILKKNTITFVSYQCQGATALEQAMEILVLGSYTSYYSALLAGIDPTAIPFVDFFKEALRK